METGDHSEEEVVASGGSSGTGPGPDAEPPPNSAAQQDTSPADMMRVKQQMYNQCFEMTVHLQAENSKRTCSPSDAERELPGFVTELERVKTIHFNNTLTLHRMQMWNAIGEKLKQNDSEARALKDVSGRCMGLCSNVKELQQEIRDLQDEISEIQRNRLGMKRLMLEKMKEMEELKTSCEHPDSEKYRKHLEKGQENLEKHKRMCVLAQNVLRGVLMASKTNWLDDPNLRDIGMTLEEPPISD